MHLCVNIKHTNAIRVWRGLEDTKLVIVHTLYPFQKIAVEAEKSGERN